MWPWIAHPSFVEVCNCSMFCFTLLYVHSSIAIILMGKRESWLLCLICLPGVSWWLSGSSLRCHGVVCGLWLWYFLIILTIFVYSFWYMNIWETGGMFLTIKFVSAIYEGFSQKVLKSDHWFQSRCFFVWFDSLRPSQHFFSYVGTGLPGLNQ